MITLGESERRTLIALGRRQLDWNGHLGARIVTTETALGIYTTPPMDVMCFLAFPTIETQAGVDSTIALASLVAELEASDTGRFDPSTLTEMKAPVTRGPNLGHLPPAEGWQMPITAIASDIMPIVEEAVAEFTQRAQGLSARGQEVIAEEIWDRPAWAGLPMRVLHAARRLRLLTAEPVRIAAATNGPWKRLSTPRGQVFVHSTGEAARLGLHVVR